MKLTGIEAARGIAAAMVVFYHAANHMRLNIGYLPLGGVAHFGHAGVDFFFVLSGFIIFFVHGKDIGIKSKLSHYAQRRFTRIYPLYWFVILLTLVLEMAFGKGNHPDLKFVLQSISLFPTISDPYIGVAWTLQHEFIFYFMFAIVIVHARIGLLIFLLWFLIIIANWYSGFMMDDGALAKKLTSPFSIEFFFGMFAAWLTLNHVNTFRNKQLPLESLLKLKEDLNIFLIIGVILFIGFGIAENLNLFDGFASNGRLAYGLSSILIVLGLARKNKKDHWITTKIASTLGSASFSIYLTHLIFIGIVYKILEITGIFTELPVWFIYLLLSASGICGGILISRLIEYPMIAFVRNNIFIR